jgi:hypothetical protein
MKGMFGKTKVVLILAAVMILAFTVSPFAMMGAGTTSGTGIGMMGGSVVSGTGTTTGTGTTSGTTTTGTTTTVGTGMMGGTIIGSNGTTTIITPGTGMMGGGGTTTSGGMMGGGVVGGNMMVSTGGFGMMGGTAGAPIVGSDGTAYVTSMMPSVTPGTNPTATSFVSNMMAVSTSGQTIKLSINGIMSKPVSASGITVNGTTGNFVMSTVSLPNVSDYSIMHDYSTTAGKSVLFWMQTPFTSSSVPVAIQMDGRYASQPVIANNMIYVTTTNNGYAMMQGIDVFGTTFPNYTASSTAKAYMYIFQMDGTLVSKTQLQ